ncbi:MAG TPA: DCC1-like thiol-disulfide oxidoreductase family protein [Candidatus Kapabacteria bacterium]|jgi:predicted DCC family thiol-disulfide oxidoreductase YuxK|nr:DUF393 domain-containing protein [Ignavibacteria bacterium]HRI31116.1 DCC1-like thiol-disulfide oxidoreductase family protein [Candidatus Kapabacteria bacterium]HRK58399.1 DCC1-like thiol-disulfide oxidoreductase family protein [Candidatus Kapabacteria bacterium]
MVSQERTIVFFDGVCGLCNSMVDWLIRADRHRHLYFSPLQGITAQEHGINLPADKDPDTLICYTSGKQYERSDAILHIVRRLGLPYSLLCIFVLIPRPVRNAMYNILAAKRYQIFGKKESCRLPSPEERQYFLP